MADAVAISEKLENVFRHIHQTRMHDVPILNEALKVETVGTQEWNGRWLSILITPWFINLMLLPQTDEEQESWKTLKLGDTQGYSFPAGRLDFIVGEEAELGRFQMCSLFSPVLEFEDHDTAVATAEASLEALLKDPEAESAPTPDHHMLGIAKGNFPTEEQVENAKLLDEALTNTSGPTEVSRRDLFTGQGDSKEPAVR